MTREKEIGDQLVVSVTCSHVEVRKTGVMGTSFLSVTASEKAKEGTVDHSFRVLGVNVPLC